MSDGRFLCSEHFRRFFIFIFFISLFTLRRRFESTKRVSDCAFILHLFFYTCVSRKRILIDRAWSSTLGPVPFRGPWRWCFCPGGHYDWHCMYLFCILHLCQIAFYTNIHRYPFFLQSFKFSPSYIQSSLRIKPKKPSVQTSSPKPQYPIPIHAPPEQPYTYQTFPPDSRNPSSALALVVLFHRQGKRLAKREPAKQATHASTLSAENAVYLIV